MLQTLMIADDSIPLHSLIKVQLQADALNFHSVYDGGEAVSAAALIMPDLILLDVDMPRMDGFEACLRIKADPKTASIPIIFLSADSISSDKMKGFELGAVDYIVKPFKPEELISRVRALLQPVPVSTDSLLVDSLTGLWNKGFFEKHLKGQFSLSQRTNLPLACTVIEIDQLGTISTKLGAQMANQVVRRIAHVLSSEAGVKSTVCCLPNRRFAILSSDTDRFEASATAWKLRQAIETNFSSERGIDMEITCSFGLCDTLIAPVDTLLERASIAANRAGNRGGNCVSIARAPAKVPLAA